MAACNFWKWLTHADAFPPANKKALLFSRALLGGLETLPENLKRLVPRKANNIKMRDGEQVSKVHLHMRNRALDRKSMFTFALRTGEAYEEIQRLMLVDTGVHAEFCVQPDNDTQRGDFDRSAWGDLNALHTGKVVGDEAGRPHHSARGYKAAKHRLPIRLHKADSSTFAVRAALSF